MTDDSQLGDGTIDVSDIPPVLLGLGIVDSLEYEVDIELEEAAAWRRRFMEADSPDEADQLIAELSREMYERGIVEVDEDGNARTPFTPTLFDQEDR